MGTAYVDKQISRGKTKREALRLLRRHITDAAFSALRADGALLGGFTAAPASIAVELGCTCSTTTGSRARSATSRRSSLRSSTDTCSRPLGPDCSRGLVVVLGWVFMRFIGGVTQQEYVRRTREFRPSQCLPVGVDVGERDALALIADHHGDVVGGPLAFALTEPGVRSLEQGL